MPTKPRVISVPMSKISVKDVHAKLTETLTVAFKSHCSIRSSAAVTMPDPSTISYLSIPYSCEWDRSKDYSSEKELQNCI